MSPDDLVSLPEAARVSERSERTLRRWIDAGTLTRHEGPPPRRGGPAPVLVSRLELLAHLATTGQQPREAQADTPGNVAPGMTATAPGTPGEDQAGEVARLRHELERTRHEAELRTLADRVARLDREAELRDREAELRERELRRLELELTHARQDAADWRDRHDAREAELRALRGERGLPWWRRLIGGPAPELPDGDA